MTIEEPSRDSNGQDRLEKAQCLLSTRTHKYLIKRAANDCTLMVGCSWIHSMDHGMLTQKVGFTHLSLGKDEQHRKARLPAIFLEDELFVGKESTSVRTIHKILFQSYSSPYIYSDVSTIRKLIKSTSGPSIEKAASCYTRSAQAKRPTDTIPSSSGVQWVRPGIPSSHAVGCAIARLHQSRA